MNDITEKEMAEVVCSIGYTLANRLLTDKIRIARLERALYKMGYFLDKNMEIKKVKITKLN